MSCCVLGITALQLYWNYANYKISVLNFKKSANLAFGNAINREIAAQQDQLILKMKHWLADTSFVEITCDTKNRDSMTAFTIRDVHPRFAEDSTRKSKYFQMGIDSIREKISVITPQLKAAFIRHFSENTFKRDISNGSIWYYTQGLGDSITLAFNQVEPNPAQIARFFKAELAEKGIKSAFKLEFSLSQTKQAQEEFKAKNDTMNVKNAFVTAIQDASLRRPYKSYLFLARLENTNRFYINEMKGLIGSSLLLIAITIFCFYYTLKTLFSQQKLVAMKNQFISNMTHEINTPIASIQVTADALLQFEMDSDSQKAYLEIIAYQTRKLGKLTEEILENTKLEHQAFLLDERITLVALLRTVVQGLNLDDKTTWDLPANDISIKGNALHLSQALTNIIENAVKYQGNGMPEIHISLHKDAEQATIQLADKGPGIPDSYKSKIFDPFFRVPNGNEHRVKGYGLGLSYVKKVLHLHKGHIRVADNQPRGTVFIVQLPIDHA